MRRGSAYYLYHPYGMEKDAFWGQFGRGIINLIPGSIRSSASDIGRALATSRTWQGFVNKPWVKNLGTDYANLKEVIKNTAVGKTTRGWWANAAKGGAGEAAQAGAQAAAKNTAEAVAQGTAQAGTEAVAKNTAEAVAKNTAQAGTEAVAKNTAQAGTEAVAKNTADAGANAAQASKEMAEAGTDAAIETSKNTAKATEATKAPWRPTKMGVAGATVGIGGGAYLGMSGGPDPTYYAGNMAGYTNY